MTRTRLAVSLVAFVAAAGLAFPLRSADPPASSPEATTADDEAAETGSSDFQRLMQRGRKAYNESEWKRAAESYRRAAQLAPSRAEAYRNLARAHFMGEEYARAAALYDHYLELAPKSADTSRIERERKLATHRAGDAVWTKPDAQKRVLEALREALTDGEAYTEGGGGAWGLYETLLRTGYVHPDLAHFQTRLQERLLEEFRKRVTPESKQPTPVLSLQDWQRQQRRLEAARTLTEDANNRDRIDDRMRVVESALALLNGRAEEAAEEAASAREANRDLPFLRWFELAALVGAERYDDADARIQTIVENSESLSDTDRRYLRALESIVAHRRGDAESAAASYRRVLR